MAVVNNTIRAEVDFIAYKGDTFNPVITFTDAASAPIDFTGCTIVMQIRDSKKVLMVELIEGNGFTRAANVLTFNKVLDFKEGTTYEHDMQVTYPDGVVKTLIGGKFTLTKDITVPA